MVEVVQAHLTRIERFNPQVNAIVTFVPDQALAAARDADRALARGEAIGPLFGLPVAHKDLHDTAGIRTTYGSPIYQRHVPTTDCLIVERLKRAGAITVGKTNTPEFGAGSQTFNPVFGATRNPYDLRKTCGGSSGGAAVALACGMMPIADGSDMGGSLRNPASFCNVVGFRPSPGRVPSWPSIHGWGTLSVDGPMARSVADVALMLTAIAGPDPRSPIALDDSPDLFAQPLERSFRGAKIGWSDLGLPFEPAVREVANRQRRAFEELGCEVEDADPFLAEADAVFKGLRALSFASKLDREWTRHRDQLKDTVCWNIEEGHRLTARELGRLETVRTTLFHRMRRFFERYAFLVTPTVQVLPFDVEQPYPTEIAGVRMETYIDWMKSCYFISTVGHPALAVPGGLTDDGLPVGLQIVGRYRDDFGVLQLGHAFERATGWGKRLPPLVAQG